MLRKSCWLETADTVVGKKVYVKGRPDMIGIITEVRTSQHVGTSTFNYIEARVYYCKSKRLSKWSPTRYHLCDLDKYFAEINQYYSAAALCMQIAEQGKAEWEQR